MDDLQQQGLVVRVTGHEVWVDIDGQVVPCLQRGKMRRRPGAPIAAGDLVTIRLPGRPGGQGTIEDIAPRESYLSRYVQRDRGERIIVANVATLFVVTSLRSPAVHYSFVDRVLVSGERGNVRAHVVLNKTDLLGDGEADELVSVYEGCGYPVSRTSAESGDGVDELTALLGREVYAFVGASGVGKSSLLNRIDPALDLETRGVQKTGRGRHTTTYSQLYPFRDGYLADTPGVQTFGFAGDDRNELPACFPELRAYDGQCRFQPCTHSHEPGCAVKDAVEAGTVAQSRYDSYLQILAEIDERESRRTY
jgi:ribosome biogenesis GTPase